MRTFQPKADEGVFLGYSLNSKAYRIYNKRMQKIEESVHVVFYEGNKKVLLNDDLSDRFKELMIKDSEKGSSKGNNSIIQIEDESDDEKQPMLSNNQTMK